VLFSKIRRYLPWYEKNSSLDPLTALSRHLPSTAWA